MKEPVSIAEDTREDDEYDPLKRQPDYKQIGHRGHDKGSESMRWR